MTKNPRKTASFSIGIAIALVIVFYTINKTKNLLEGPVITIKAPMNGSIVDRPLVTVEGVTRNISHMTINGHPAPVDENGSFREQLVVKDGYTIISVVGTDRFGKTQEKTVELIRKEKIFTTLHD